VRVNPSRNNVVRSVAAGLNRAAMVKSPLKGLKESLAWTFLIIAGTF
jgi:hypothetical protein